MLFADSHSTSGPCKGQMNYLVRASDCKGKVGSDLHMNGAWCLSGRFGALRLEGRRFESLSSRHVETLGKSFTGSCL